MPEYQNQEIEKILQKINQAEKIAIEKNVGIYFFFDLDSNSYWFEEKSGEEEIEKIESSLDFIEGKNTFEERISGSISFKIFPTGKKEFFLLYIYDPERNEYYTLYSNPYSDIEILKGEVKFEEIY